MRTSTPTSRFDNLTRRGLHIAVATAGLILGACRNGGGGGDTNSGPSALTGAQINAQNRIDFACNINSSASQYLSTPSYTTASDPPNYPEGTTYYEQTWLINGIGLGRPEQHSLKAIVLIPPASLPKNGVYVTIHGTDPSFLTPTSLTLANTRDNDDRWLQKGYAVVYVARRGYFGSTGIPAASDEAYTSADEANQVVDIGSYNASYLRWQSASMTSALGYMASLPILNGYMHSIVLQGASLGADTAIFTAAQSAVFQAATRKAVIRFTGLNSQNYLAFADNLIGERAATASVAAQVNTPTLWYGGQLDSTTNLGQLACNFKTYTARSKQNDQFYIVPGMEHGQSIDIANSTFAPSINLYLRAQGFAGF